MKVYKDGEAASIRYLHNAQGQLVFKGEPTAEQTLPDETTLGTSFIDWFKRNFSWLYAAAQANTSIGTAYVYDGDNEIPAWALLGEYDNGSAKGAGRTEYLWLPTEDGGAIPVGIYRGSQFYAIHSDHLGTPRLMTNETNKPVWQWPYSAFGSNKPTGVLKATANPKAAITNRPVLLQATAAPEMNLGFPGQMRDVETGMVYNYFRHFDPKTGTYIQMDPIGMLGGWNRRGYVSGNPLTYVDPYGLFGWADMPTAPDWLVDGAAGVGDAMSFGAIDWIRDRQGWNDSVSKCSGAYAGGELAGIGLGLAMGGAGLAKAGFRAEFGAWKQGGKWFAGGRKMPHFHMGTGPGMAMHHLPYQAGNWARNFSANMSRGKAGEDMKNMAAAAYGFAAAATGAMNDDCTCKR